MTDYTPLHNRQRTHLAETD